MKRKIVFDNTLYDGTEVSCYTISIDRAPPKQEDIIVIPDLPVEIIAIILEKYIDGISSAREIACLRIAGLEEALPDNIIEFYQGKIKKNENAFERVPHADFTNNMRLLHHGIKIETLFDDIMQRVRDHGLRLLQQRAYRESPVVLWKKPWNRWRIIRQDVLRMILLNVVARVSRFGWSLYLHNSKSGLVGAPFSVYHISTFDLCLGDGATDMSRIDLSMDKY